MRTHHSQHRSKIQKIACLVSLAIALAVVTPVLAAYLGPNRTRIESQPSCNIILNECQYVAAKGDYRYHQVDSWSCSNESKPWKSYPSQPSGCDSSSVGDTYWSKDESTQDVTVTYPPATITGVLQNCIVKNSWCTTAPQLALSGYEPVAGYKILGIEGTQNGQNFACTGTTCTVPLLEGSNNFTYWALSSWTDTSLMGTLNAKVDTVKPTISGTITATSGSNGWFTSPVIFNGSASDGTSGLAAFTCTLDGIALAPSSCSSITINSEGSHSLVFTAQDNAGQTNSLLQDASIDLQAPVLNVSLAGTSASNPAWYTSARLNGAASDTPTGSGIFALEYKLDQDNWTAFPASGELQLPDGKHTVEVRATDKAGLVSSSQRTFSLDSVSPAILLDAIGTFGANNWYITDLDINASASDETSGINGLEYSLDNDSWRPYTSTLNLTDGIHEISLWATDEAGLVSQLKQTYQIDTHLPGIEGSLSGVPGENGWFTSDVSISASAFDPQPGSGIDAFTYSLDAAPEDLYATPLILTDGRHTIKMKARDKAGLAYTLEQAVNVDTIPPTFDIHTALPGWVKDTFSLQGIASDDGSGLSKMEISTDGGQAWQPLTNTAAWSYQWDTSKNPNGFNEVKLRVLDKAGLSAGETFKIGVDNKAPIIDLPASWLQWDTVTLDIQEEHSGLSEARLEISDPQGRWPARMIDLDKAIFPMQLKWDRRFADGTTAPEGKYNVKVVAVDKLGNTTTENASVTILLNLPAGPTATTIPPYRPSATPTLSYTATAFPTSTATSTAVIQGFGSTQEPQGTATPRSAVTSTPRATPAQNSVVEWFESIFPSQSNTVTTTTEISSLGIPAPTTDAGSNVLWGATAAAVMGSLAAYALEEKRKLEEEQAKQAALEAREEERHEKIKAQQMEKLEAKWAQERAWEEAREAEEERKEAIYQAHMETRVLGREIKEEGKRVAEEKAERERITEQKRVEEKKEALERQAAISGSYTSLLQRENDASQQEQNWWEKTKSFVSANIIQPVDQYIYQPYVKPVVEIKEKSEEKIADLINKTIYQPYIQPAVDSTKQFLNDAGEWVDEKKKMVQEKFTSDLEDTKQSLISAGSWINQNIYQPYIKPQVEKAIEKATLINEKVYQPYIKPIVEKTEQVLINTATSINEKIYQPYIKPIVDTVADKTKEFIVAGVSAINEKVVEPIKSDINRDVRTLTSIGSWINETIYQPIFEPVVSDINKYIYKPLADKTDAWLDKYGEWVHNALDVVGFIPGVGDIADGLNGLVYLAEGRYIEASISALAMIPLVGDLGKVGKWGVKLGEEVVEEAAEKVVKQVVEKTVQEGLEEIAEKTAKEALGDFVQAGAKEGLEEVSEEYVQRTLKETIPGTVTKLPTDIAENLTPRSAADLAEKMTNELGGTRVWVSTEQGTIYITKAPDEGFDLAKQLRETDPANKKEIKKIIRRVTELTSRGSGNHVVLGPFGKGGEFIQKALDTNGIFWDVGDDLWKELEDTGIDMFEFNDDFLQYHVEKNIDSFDIIVKDASKEIRSFNNSVPKEWTEISYTQKEILDLATMPDAPYELVNNSWIRTDLIKK